MCGREERLNSGARSERESPDIAKFVHDHVELDKALARGVNAALRRHKLLGESVAGWVDGQVVIIPPEEIQILELDGEFERVLTVPVSNGEPAVRRVEGEPEVMNDILGRITFNSEQCGGRPCIRGMRIRVSDVLELLASGLTPEQILIEMPDLELDDIVAALRYASRRLDHSILKS